MSQRARLLTLLGVLLVLAGALGAYAYYGVFRVQKSEDAQKKAELKLFSFDRDSVQKLTVTAKGDTTSLERAEGLTFKIASPIQAPADQGVIAALLNKIGSDSVKKLATEKPEKLSDYGLDKPQIKVTATIKDGKQEWLAIGEENKFDNTLFAQTSRSPAVYVADDSLKYPLDKGTFDLREKRLLPLEDKDIAGVSFEGGDQRYAFTRSGEDCQLTEPEKAPGDSSECNRVVSAVRSVRAQAIPAETVDDPGKYGFDHPSAKLVVSQANGTRTELTVGEVRDEAKDAKADKDAKPKEKYYARAGVGFVAEIADTFLKDVTRTPAQLLDKRLLPGLDRNKVMQIKFSGPENYVVERRPGKDGAEETWQVLSPQAGPGKKWKMDSILQGLSNIKGKAIAEEKPRDLKKYGLDQPVRTIALFGEGGKDVGKIQVGAAVEDQKDTYYVKSSASSRVYEMEKHNLDGLSQTVAEIMENPPQAQNQDSTPAAPAESKAP